MALQYYRTVLLNVADENDKNIAANTPVYIRNENGSYASIYRDQLGQSEIVQDGSQNKTNEKGEFYFYAEGGVYTQESNNESTRIEVVGVDYIGNKISIHNSSEAAHPELSAFITSEADRAETSADYAMTAGWVYTSVSDGESARVDGDSFWVISGESNYVLELWEMGVSSATDTGKRTINKSYIDMVVNPTYKNSVIGGDFIGQNPTLRSGSQVVTFTNQDELIYRGYEKGIKWRSGNEFTVTSVSGLSGKYIAGCFLMYSENENNLPNDTFTANAILTSNSSGDLQIPSDLIKGVVTINSKTRLVYSYGLVSDSDALNLLVGFSDTPQDSTLYATGFFGVVSSSPIDVYGLVSQVLISDKSRYGIYKIYDSRIGVIEQLIDEGIAEVKDEANKDSLKNANTNEFLFGDFISGVPQIRSGSDIVNLIDDQFARRGINKGINWRVGGNEYAFTQRINNLNGKFIFSAFYASNDDNSDLPPFAYAFSVSDSGSLSTLQDITTGFVEISESFRLCWFKGKVNDSNAVKMACGSTYQPTTSSLNAGGFYLSSADTEIDENYAVKAVLLTDISRKQVAINSPSKKTGSVVISPQGESTFVTGLQGVNTVTRELLPFGKQGIDTTKVFNFLKDSVNGKVAKVATDDVAPQRAFGTTIGANHGFIMGKYLVPSHDKDESDVGSVWSIGSDEFVILGIRTPDTLWIAHKDSNASSSLISGNFTHVSGGINTSSFTGTIEKSQQFYPPFQNYSMQILVDGIDKSIGSYTYSKSVKFIETYDVLDREQVIDWYINDRQSGELEPYGKSASYSVSMIYDFDIEANCTIYSDISFIKDTPIQDLMFMQATVEEIDRYYIPKTLPFTQGGQSFDYNMIENSRKVSDNSAGTVFFDSSKVEAGGLLMDRYIGLNDTSNTLFAMGFIPTLSAESATRRANTSAFSWEIRGNTDKMYPRVVDKGDFTALAGEHYSVVAYRNALLKDYVLTSKYPVRTSQGDYYYIDAHNVDAANRVELPSDYHGRKFEVVESRNISVFGESATSSVLLNISTVGTYGFICLKFS